MDPLDAYRKYRKRQGANVDRPPVLFAADDNGEPGEHNPARSAPVASIVEAIARGGGEALPGGVSSDIKMLECDGARYCIKQALPKLKVEADWRAPIERNHSEAEWLRVVAEISPSSVPRILHEERAAGWFVMEYLPPEHYPVWKAQLRDGAIDPSMAARVGSELAKIHAHTA
ncbi:MAG: phosphotransferase, partial [Betaproteobacteria bacterium]